MIRGSTARKGYRYILCNLDMKGKERRGAEEDDIMRRVFTEYV
jgi:hypothetical protein